MEYMEIRNLLELVEQYQTSAIILSSILALMIMRPVILAIVDMFRTFISERQNALTDMRKRLELHNAEYEATKKRETALENKLDAIHTEHSNELKDMRAKHELMETKLLACNDQMDKRVDEAVQASNEKHQQNVTKISLLEKEISELKLNIQHERDLRKTAEKDREIALIAQAKAEATATERQKVIIMLRDLLHTTAPSAGNNKDVAVHPAQADEKISEVVTEKLDNKSVS